MNAVAQAEPLSEGRIRNWFAGSADVVIDVFRFELAAGPEPVLLLYCEGLADAERIDQVVLPGLHSTLNGLAAVRADELERSKTLLLRPIDAGDPLEEMSLRIYSGELVLFFAKPGILYALDIAQPPNRKPEESSTEVSIKGPRDSFTEDLVANVALVRKRLKTRSLKVEKIVIGERSHTSVALLYIDGVINPEIADEARSRLADLKVDGLMGSGQLEEALAGTKFAFFPLLDNSGRPDYVSDCLLRGRFAVIVDGAPMALIAPADLTMVMKSPEDVHFPYYYVTLERLLRLMGLVISIFLPGFWIAVSSFNLDQIPFPLLATISSARLGLPLSASMDFFIMLALFEMFREAGMRLPKAVGQTVTVVGGLIVGDAAIRAGLTGPVTLVMASISTISMFTLVNQSLAGTVTVLRVFIIIVSGIFGMWGFMLAVIGLVTYLATLESFGVPYLSPLSPPIFADMTAAVLAKPWHRMKRRPESLKTVDRTRQGEDES